MQETTNISLCLYFLFQVLAVLLSKIVTYEKGMVMQKC